MRKKKIPLFCKLKKKSIFYTPSPSAMFMCGYGFRYRPYKQCKNCPISSKDFDFNNK